MSWTQATALAFVVLVTAAIFYDVLAFAFGGPRATFSDVFQRASNRSLFFVAVLAFALGVLFGHVFLTQEE